MKPSYIGLLCGVLGVALLIIPANNKNKPEPRPVVQDLPQQAFASYEQLWRKLAKETADKLDAGELTTEKETWDFLAAGQAPARKLAFDNLAKSEQEYFTQQGGWSAVSHSKLLRSYVK